MAPFYGAERLSWLRALGRNSVSLSPSTERVPTVSLSELMALANGSASETQFAEWLRATRSRSNAGEHRAIRANARRDRVTAGRCGFWMAKHEQTQGGSVGRRYCLDRYPRCAQIARTRNLLSGS